jgi:prepilin peptidase CpaA
VNVVLVVGIVVSGLAACVTDLGSRRIPNWLTFGSAALALAVHAALDGWVGARHAGIGWIVGTALFMPMFLLRGMGGGDVKLLAAFGAWLGGQEVLWLAAYASIVGGFLSIALAIQHGYLRALCRNLSNLFRFWWLAGPRPMPSLTLEQGTGPRLAFAVPMFVGALVTLWRH